MDIADAKIGTEGDVKVALEEGKVVLTFVHQHASGEVNLVVKEDAKYFLEKLKAVSPEWAKFLISAAEGALP